VWTVRSELELVRVLGALQFRNPEMHFWFRGEREYHENALPKRLRIAPAESVVTGKGVAWLDKHSSIDRAIRDRSALARLAILQHYGCPTLMLFASLICVSTSQARLVSTSRARTMEVYILERVTAAEYAGGTPT
jgi:hypothetical protein